MTVNMLQMNRDKTELVVQVQVITYLRPLRPISVCDQLISKSSVARNIGVLYDTFISIKHHVSHIQYRFFDGKVKRCNYVTLTAGTYYPLLKREVVLAVM